MMILIAGDFCPQASVAALFEERRFADVLSEIKTVTDSCDYSIANFECAIADNNTEPSTKYGPLRSCSEAGVYALKWAGFDGVTLANNHFYDYGEAAVERALQCFRECGVDYVGGGRNITEASTILYKTIKGIRVAFINCCEHEFSIATESTGGCNPLNPIQQYYAIQEAKKRADVVLIIVHGGHEHFQLPSPRMQETYRFFVDAGADLVINHHQHCFSGYEIYNGHPIVYGLGNFCFDKEKIMRPTWYEGLLCVIEIGNKINIEILPIEQCKGEPRVKLLKCGRINETVNSLSTIIANRDLLEQSYNDFLKANDKVYLEAMEPYPPLLMRLYRRGIIRSGLTKTRLLKIFDLINCESHLDRMRAAVLRRALEL